MTVDSTTSTRPDIRTRDDTVLARKPRGMGIAGL